MILVHFNSSLLGQILVNECKFLIWSRWIYKFSFQYKYLDFIFKKIWQLNTAMNLQESLRL